MSLTSFYITLGLMCCVHQLSVRGSPPMNIRRLYENGFDTRFKKDITFPQPDEDVLELEQLKHKPLENPESPIESAIEDPINRQDISPSLEKQLEMETTKSISANIGQREEEESTAVQHRPPTLPQHSGGQITSNEHPDQQQINQDIDSEKLPSPVKPFYGAARLAFGQNPEVLPTLSTTTTTTTTAASIIASSTDSVPEVIVTSPVTVSPPPSSSSIPSQFASPNEKEMEETVAAELEATKTEERRSIDMMPPKIAESLLKHSDGQYSSFDMAQYVFWTGDEAGVARTVEEFIQQGLMSRENAIKFLREIRLGIEYLQNSYANRIFPDQLKGNDDKKNSPFRGQPTSATTMTTTKAPQSSTTEKQIVEPENLNPNLRKTLEGIPSLLRLQEISNSRNKDNIDYDELAGRARLADFIYAEYSLEEVIYQLGKMMFAQSLTHGSDQAQNALQRLTGFLESEGDRGLISPSLQKKVLDVLLAALSDTLAEHPELLAAARANLGNSFHKLPHNSLDPLSKH